MFALCCLRVSSIGPVSEALATARRIGNLSVRPKDEAKRIATRLPPYQSKTSGSIRRIAEQKRSLSQDDRDCHGIGEYLRTIWLKRKAVWHLRSSGHQGWYVGGRAGRDER